MFFLRNERSNVARYLSNKWKSFVNASPSMVLESWIRGNAPGCFGTSYVASAAGAKTWVKYVVFFSALTGGICRCLLFCKILGWSLTDEQQPQKKISIYISETNPSIHPHAFCLALASGQLRSQAEAAVGSSFAGGGSRDVIGHEWLYGAKRTGKRWSGSHVSRTTSRRTRTPLLLVCSVVSLFVWFSSGAFCGGLLV